MYNTNARSAEVRFLGKAVLCTAAAMCAAAPVAAHAEGSGHQIAVVDVAYIFKNHAGIKAQVGAVEAELKSYEQELSGKRDELKNAAAELKTFKVGSPEYAAAEERIAGMESRLRLDMARKRKEISDAEAKIYFDNYQRISTGVKYLANHYKINLVLRYNSEEMDLEQGESVIRGVMKSIVYHDDALDMTKGVMQYLDQTMKVAGAGAPNATR
jgi:Skp family chaperone for outer membrane proteins